MGSNVFGIGFGELVFLAILALIIFGPKRIPELAQTIGRLIQQIRQATSGIENEVRQLMDAQGNPSTWLSGESPPKAPPRGPSQGTPFTPFQPPQGPAGTAQPVPAVPELPPGRGPCEETPPPAPSRPQQEDEPGDSPPPPSSLPG